VRGAEAVAEQARLFSGLTPFARPALLGAARFVVAPHGEPFSVLGIAVAHGKIVEIDVVADPERLRQLDLTVLDQ
jgi:RNA polymerase sigma-70 factor (ECF subfamily)